MRSLARRRTIADPSAPVPPRSPLSGGWQPRLRRALEQDLFVLHFQPIVSLEDGRLHHHEALLRLDDGDPRGLVAPAAFLPFAERSGLVREIDAHVIGKVLALLGSNEAARETLGAVAVNISALSASEPALLGRIRSGLVRHGVAPERLVLELTETAAVTDMRSARALCAGALELGCGVALDDFGAGYGSFRYLKQLPFSHLKIDGEFIHGIARSHTDRLVVEALVRVSRGLGRETIAEFVQDQESISLLRALDVDYAQGHGIGRPRPLAALGC